MPETETPLAVGRLLSIQQLADAVGMSRATVRTKLKHVQPASKGGLKNATLYNSLVALPALYGCIPGIRE